MRRPAVNEDSEDPLLGTDEESASLNPTPRADAQEAAVNVPQVLLRREFRKPLAIVCFSMLCQQLSGESLLPPTLHICTANRVFPALRCQRG